MKGNILASLILAVILGAAGWTLWKGFGPVVEEPASGKSDEIVLMDFYANWCGPCQRMKPIVHALAEDLKGRATVLEINVDSSQSLAQRYNVKSIPCFIVTKNGKEIARKTGSMPKESLRALTGL